MKMVVSWPGVALSAVLVAGAVVSGVFHVEALPLLLAGAAVGLFAPSPLAFAPKE